MAKIFVSYSRSVKDEVRKVINLLIASGHEVWWDGDIPIMADWWATILKHIEWCDVFIFVASEKSVESAYCLAELKYARDCGRPILPFMLDDPSQLTLPETLPARGQWLIYDGEPDNMLASINNALTVIDWHKYKHIKVRRPPEPLKGGKSLAKQFQQARKLANQKHFDEARKLLHDIKDVDYGEWGADCDAWLNCLASYEPIMELVDDESTVPRARTNWAIHVRKYGAEFDPHDIATKIATASIREKERPTWLLYVALIVFVLVVAGIAIALLSGNNAGGENPAPTIVAQGGDDNGATDEARLVPTTAIAQGDADGEDTNNVGTAFLPSETPEPTPTPTDEPTPTVTATLTETLIPLNPTEVEETVIAEMALIQSERRLTEEAIASETALSETVIASSWTPTPTADIRATAEARLQTQEAQTATQAWIDSWTPTPTATFTPTPTLTPTNTPTPTPTLTPLEEALQRARNFTGTQNSDWTPFEHDFDGVTMVLVPAGCFMMGSDNGDSDERPIHEQCFDEPFWIDKYEVTQAQFASFGGTKANNNWFAGDNLPVERITWFEARDFCALRGASLPTEAQWEYAARGVESWVYPWGNDFVGDNAVYRSNSGSRTADVGSRPNGASWVGAMDMAGNVWEWTSSLFESYPYDANDGREQDTGDRTDLQRVLRGGSIYISTFSLRSADRSWYSPNVVNSDFGLRCLRSY